MKKHNLLGIIILLLATVPGLYIAYQYLNINRLEGRILPVTYINEIDVSGKSREEAIELIKKHYGDKDNKKIIVKCNDKDYSLNFSNLGIEYNVEEVVGVALERDEKSKFLDIIKGVPKKNNRTYKLNMNYDKRALTTFIDEIEKATNTLEKRAEIKIDEQGSINIENEKVGLQVDREFLENEISKKIDYSNDESTVVEAKIHEVIPDITLETLQPVDKLLSSFSTYYGGSSAGRTHNIKLAVQKINGVLLMPGEVFSFNTIVGERSPEKGYQPAPVIINNKLVDGYGGGVCQVSTTLYNAVLRCGLKSIQRLNHTLVPSYISPGFDATVSETIDYKFKNSFDYPIYIQGFTKNGNLFFSIYSNAALSKVKYTLVNEIYEKTEADTIYEDDPEKLAGTKEKVQSPFWGCKVKVYLIGKENGVEVSKTLISKDVYKRVDGIIKVGTKTS